MTQAFDGVTWVTFVATDETPPDSLPYAGRVVGISTIPEGMGAGADNPGTLMGVRGYPRAGAGVGQTEYVMIGALDAHSVDFVAALPAQSGGWVNKAAELAFQDAVVAFTGFGVPLPDVKLHLQALYDAAVANGKDVAATGVDPTPDRSTGPRVVPEASPIVVIPGF